jgi:hypothetical protein
MIDLVTLQIVRDFVAIFGVIAGFSYYVIIVRNTQKIRQRENLFLRFQSFDKTYSEAAFDLLNTDWGSTFEDYRKNPLESRINFDYIQMNYNIVGSMLKQGIIDPDLLYQITGPRRLMLVWETIENIVQNYRETFNDPTFVESFEYLYNETKKRFPDIKTRRN